MSLFGKVVRTVINTAMVPVAMAKDVVTLGGASTDKRQTYTAELLQKIKDEAED
jgi:hypothetical protein